MPKKEAMSATKQLRKGHHPDDLTWREQDILHLLSKRLTNREIADRLHLAESTVKDYVSNILSKLYVKNRRQAVEAAERLGLLEQAQPVDAAPASSLPPEKTPFVGRETELEEILHQLEETRLLTLIGPGGIGKTRLALRAAELTTDRYQDGCCFIPLAPLRSAEGLVQAIAEGIKYPIATQEPPMRQLLRYLRPQHMLLVLDNFEHLLEGAEFVSQILQEAPQIRLLVSSRERLNLVSETVLNIEGMHFPVEEDRQGEDLPDALRFFVQSARRVHPTFDPTRDELLAIARICRFVEGMPLAIELAAAWLHLLSVDEIMDELKSSLDILSSELRDAPERHRSIRAIFDHSWSMLNQEEQRIFARLSLFRGGFTREAAREVVGASLGQLSGLVDKSLLSHDPTTGRLESHELLRQYGQQKLEETSDDLREAREKHGAYFADFMESGWVGLRGRCQEETLQLIEADLENVREAWEYDLQEQNVSRLWKYIYALWYVYWFRFWNQPGLVLFREAARTLEGVTGTEGKALHSLTLAMQSYFMSWLGMSSEGFEIANRCSKELKELNCLTGLIIALDSMCINAYFQYDFQALSQFSDRMVGVAEQVGDPWLLALALYAAGLAAIANNDFLKAREFAVKQLALSEENGSEADLSTPLIVLGHAALGLGDLNKAREYYLRCTEISEKSRFYYAIQTASKYLAKVSLTLGKLEEAEKYLQQSLKISSEIGFVRDVVNLFYEYARLFAARGEVEEAVSLLALVIQHPASDRIRMLDGRIRDNAEDLLRDLESELDLAVFQKALARGRDLTLDETTSEMLGRKLDGSLDA
jgi:predicted ATPase/DNA-binding CsgD family transcriptional regulator